MSELENQYSSLFGTKTSKGQLRGGFLLLALGVVLGLAALILFFLSYQATGQDQTTWRHLALPLGTAAFGLILLGITVALPTTTGLRVAAWVGIVCTLGGAMLLAFHYPNNFNVSAQNRGKGVADYLPLDLGLYVIGLGLQLAAIVSSIVGFYLGRVGPAAKAEGDEDDETYGPGYEVPDWVVERDIEYAMKKFGVEVVGGKGSASAGMKVNINDSFGANMTIGGLGKARTVQLDSTQVDEGVTQLSGVRPNKKGALPGEWADESTKALIAFRKQKSANPTMYTPKKRGFWARLFGGRSKATPAASGASAAPKAAVPTNGNTGKFVGRGKTIVIDDEAPARGKKGGSN
ncbi:MAG: hypothetical protein V4510_10225 [bacterium]